MKTRSLVLAVTCLAAIASTTSSVTAQNSADHEKSEVIAVIEAEKDTYLAFNEMGLADTWIRQPTSLKLYVGNGKEERFDGYAAIEKHDRENLARERALPPGQRAQFAFSDYRVTIQGDSAWVTCHARWSGFAENVPASGTQSRIYVLRREYGRWKIALMAITQLTFERSPAPVPSTPNALSMPSGL